SVSANTGTASRTGTIMIRTSNGSIARTISVTQAGAVQNRIVTFNANGGIPATQQRTVQNGQSLGNQFPANPTRNGHTFGGWFIQPSLLTQMLASTIITGNINLSARWRFTITFNGNGGQTPDPLILASGITVGELPRPNRDNHRFLGWATSQSGGNVLPDGLLIEGNATLWARWEYVPMNYNNMNRQVLAREILNRYHGTSITGNRIIMRRWADNMTDANRRSAFANIQDTANGLMAETRRFYEENPNNFRTITSGTSAPNVFLSADLLRAILRVNDRFGNIEITAIAGGAHFGGSLDEHVRGIGVDFQSNNSIVTGTGQRPESILNYLENTWGFRTQRNRHENEVFYAGRGYVGVHNHLHLSIFGRN
ncbi:MAG: InlB B-repeat-containing protein, partial [Defluviitaleaceae bacterium]|nr:InlB B-repeat-containing protein [Defluviitaleaceae bacterium]